MEQCILSRHLNEKSSSKKSNNFSSYKKCHGKKIKYKQKGKLKRIAKQDDWVWVLQNPSIFKKCVGIKKYIGNYQLSDKCISSKISTLKTFQQGEQRRWWYCRVVSEMLEICNRKPAFLGHSENRCSESLLLGVVTNQNRVRNIIAAEACKKDRSSFLDFFKCQL